MVRSILTYLLLFTFQVSFSQTSDKSLGTKVLTVDEIVKIIPFINQNIETFSQDSFNVYFEKNINLYRNSYGLNQVYYDKSAIKVGLEQSDYCLKLGYLNHKQPQSIKEDADDRCKLYGVKYLDVRENLMMGNMSNMVLIGYTENCNFYDCLSIMILKCWKLSPGHNASLLANGQTFAVGISRDSSNNIVACYVLIDN
jgi:uncharacterized protein YkwD